MVVAGLAALLCATAPLGAQRDGDSTRISIVYTGRSLGALGVRRAQDEHELLTERAAAEGLPFKLVSHAAWRVPGITIFLSGAEPAGHELAWAVAHRGEAERLDSVRALASDNVLLLQDPWRPEPDLYALLGRNPRRAADFPDLVETHVAVSRLRPEGGNRIYIVEDPGASWPEDLGVWTIGEMNRVDVLDSRIFELALNLGGLGPRATVTRRMQQRGDAGATLVVTADLGHQVGDMGVAAPDRARLDFHALRELGYSLLVPFEFELGLGAKALGTLRDSFPDVTLLAANVRAADSTLFVASRVVEHHGVRAGLVGLVNTMVRERLPRARLADFIFEAPVAAARREVARLRKSGVTSIVVLSNLDPADNAMVASEVTGIDAIVADLPVRWAPEVTRTRVEVPARRVARAGAPLLVARSAANGLGVGRLDLDFEVRTERSGAYLTSVEHRMESVTDRTPADTALVRRIGALATSTRRSRGELMFPAFIDLLEDHPDLGTSAEVRSTGRLSKGMWESWMARAVRVGVSAEVAVIRRLEQFPPLIGKLHENEIDAWLWTEDQVVVVDMLGSDLLALLASDRRGEFVSSGIDRARGTVLGRRIRRQLYYRVATSDVLFEGTRAAHFVRARRVRREFRRETSGLFQPTRSGEGAAVKDIVRDELRRLRASARDRRYLDSIAVRLRPDTAFASMLTFNFDRPTLSFSLSDMQGGTGYERVQESRIASKDSWLIGLSGRIAVAHERRWTTTEFGVLSSYARQTVGPSGRRTASETTDDMRMDFTLLPTAHVGDGIRLLPFVRGEYDTEFSPTVDRVTGLSNPRERLVRAIGGVQVPQTDPRRRVELALVAEHDLSRPYRQYGVQSRIDLLARLGLPPRVDLEQVTYRLRSDLSYFLPARGDDATRLALRYNMVHDFLMPLVNEVGLTVTADLFFFKGKVPATQAMGSNTQIRVGLTYNRFWKPRYQPFL